MKLSTPMLQHVIEICDDRVSSLVVENGRLFRQIVEGLYRCVEQGDDDFVLSREGADLKIADNVELLTSLVPFCLNTRTLLAGLAKRLEKLALLPERREQTESVIEQVRSYIEGLSLDVPCGVSCEGTSIASLIKACGPIFDEDESSLSDRIVGYMRLTRDLCGERLYVIVGARSYFCDEELKGLVDLCVSEHFHILLIDCVANEKLACETRLLVDVDLCELSEEDDDLV